MANIKLKYTLEEANEKLKSVTIDTFPIADRQRYMIGTDMGHSTLYKYLREGCSSVVVANHLIEYIEGLKKKNVAA